MTGTFADLAAADRRREAVSSLPPRGDRLRVLVVDDDEMARHGLERAVRLLGHECRSAKDGFEGWQMHQTERADIILSDWLMPRMDGLELCRHVRSTDVEGAYTYFVFMTGLDDKEHFLRGMEAGADDYHTKPVDIDELQARLVSAARVISLYRKLAEKTVDLRRDSQNSFHMARVDALTGFSNRLRMDEDLRVLWSLPDRHQRHWCAALCDIDDFKKYNDNFGHLAGDVVLRQIAQCLGKDLRQTDVLYRYGGEEFLVLLPEQSLVEALRVMDRLRRTVELLGIRTAGEHVVTISVGVAELDVVHDTSIDDWLRRADAALYSAKRDGRNRVRLSSAPAR